MSMMFVRVSEVLKWEKQKCQVKLLSFAAK
jgi:hypothetical protein